MAGKRVRTRFAPSPTGYLHIGGLRTALFNWFYAKTCNGDFLLRIEDTDRERYVEDAMGDIINCLKWLGIDYSEGPEIGGPKGPYFQSQRLDIYHKYINQLIEEKKAYHCYCSKDRLNQIRESSKNKTGQAVYDRKCRYLTKEEESELKKENPNPIVRFKMPEHEGEIIVNDYLRGEIRFSNETQDDFVILKNDSFPTYHLANIIDDHLMEISHVLRGEEWIPSLARHFELYKAFGWNPPIFVHLPVILDPTGGKLSKRKTINLAGGEQQEIIVTVRDFINKGYLKEALINFLAFLGWGYDDKTEFMNVDELCKNFDISKIGKSSPTFHFDKLDYYNGAYIRMKDNDELAKLCRTPMIKEGLLPENNCPVDLDAYFNAQIPLIRERLKFIEDAPKHLKFFYIDKIDFKDKNELIPKKSDIETSIKSLKLTIEVLDNLSDFTIEKIEIELRNKAKEEDIKIGQLFMPIRIAVTGSSISPGLFETIFVLGKQRTLTRLNSALKFLKE